MPSTRTLSTLPGIADLRRITQSLATLDAILSEDWESRYYSFNARWDVASGDAMASMRNGSGDEWFILFSAAGAVLKGFAHERSAMSPCADNRTFTPVVQRGLALYPGLLTGFPDELAPALIEPSFSMDATTFIVWRLASAPAWQIGAIDWPSGDDPDGSEDLLALLDGAPERYASWASAYFERDVDAKAALHVFAHRPLDEALLSRLGSERTLEELAEDLLEIGYPAH
jgi:hypothetical protein